LLLDQAKSKKKKDMYTYFPMLQTEETKTLEIDGSASLVV